MVVGKRKRTRHGETRREQGSWVRLKEMKEGCSGFYSLEEAHEFRGRRRRRWGKVREETREGAGTTDTTAFNAT